MNLLKQAPTIIKPKIGAYSSTHLAYLDGLRALAALYVLIHHAQEQIYVQFPEQNFVHMFRMVFKQGRYAVDLFIVISGFCLMLPVANNNGFIRNGAVQFFKRRAKRILPTYYLALLFSYVLIQSAIGEKTGLLWDVSIPVSKWDLITHILLIQDLFHSTLYKINHTFWSISVEWHIYFLFPLLVLSSKKFGPVVTTLASIILSLALWYMLGLTTLNVYGMAPHYVALFTFGMLAASLSFSKKSYVSSLTIVLISALCAIIMHPILAEDFIVGIAAILLLITLATGKLNGLRQVLSWSPLVFIGTFAYSIYLIHAPLLQVISQYVIIPFKFSESISLIFFLLVGVPLIIGSSYLFYLVAERPFLSKRGV